MSRETFPLITTLRESITRSMCLVGPRMDMSMLSLLVLTMLIEIMLFGFQRPLLLTSKDPFSNGYLKSRLDVL